MINQVIRRLEALEQSMGTADTLRCQIRIEYFTTDAEGKPVPTGKFEIVEVGGGER
jgi:hypothetical protein